MQKLIGKQVYFDVNVFIYAVEPSENMQAYFATVSRLFELAVAGRISAMTSELTLAEALVGAYKNNRPLVALYEALISNRAELAVYPINRQILTTAALLRSQQKTALADAIHLATALHHGADFFITQDKRLQTTEGLQKLTLDSLSSSHAPAWECRMDAPASLSRNAGALPTAFPRGRVRTRKRLNRRLRRLRRFSPTA